MTIYFGRLVKLAANQLTRDFDAFAKQYDLTSTQMAMIDYLSRSEMVTQRDIEQEFNIQRSTATLILQRMEKAELVRRENLASDARQKQVLLLPKAQALETVIQAYMQESDQQLLVGYEDQQVREMTQLLENIIKGVDKHA
ncbi:MarR family winged helix-turn-helix transcriptional regulator [Lacticaseibacillus brantae]|uniref:HTH marR-type domain-containing protein n=1 Tax=Lacticaseibacillus brantae DSM 23927 TaxID=1423727 RepID=A0A0R2AWX0_9LACO|nr:MarR family transcriptional regulator [Lacticaseibacillus brantae]KRM71950.1 hypothetical protein FC34_GL000930 [Lacticaseibacillus brantae DSM 23927]